MGSLEQPRQFSSQGITAQITMQVPYKIVAPQEPLLPKDLLGDLESGNHTDTFMKVATQDVAVNNDMTLEAQLRALRSISDSQRRTFHSSWGSIPSR